MTYKLALDADRKSKAKLWFIDLDEFIAQENYEVDFTLENIGEKDFPGGEFSIDIRYDSHLGHSISLKVPEIEEGEKKTLETIKKKALAQGYGSFFGKIKSDDGEEVVIRRYDQNFSPEDSLKSSLYDIPIKRKTDIYSYYMLEVSVVSLVVLAGISILSFLFEFIL